MKEKRKAARRKVLATSTVTVDVGDLRCQGYVADISETGIYIIIPETSSPELADKLRLADKINIVANIRRQNRESFFYDSLKNIGRVTRVVEHSYGIGIALEFTKTLIDQPKTAVQSRPEEETPF